MNNRQMGHNLHHDDGRCDEFHQERRRLTEHDINEAVLEGNYYIRILTGEEKEPCQFDNKARAMSKLHEFHDRIKYLTNGEGDNLYPTPESAAFLAACESVLAPVGHYCKGCGFPSDNCVGHEECGDEPIEGTPTNTAIRWDCSYCQGILYVPYAPTYEDPDEDTPVHLCDRCRGYLSSTVRAYGGVNPHSKEGQAQLESECREARRLK